MKAHGATKRVVRRPAAALSGPSMAWALGSMTVAWSESGSILGDLVQAWCRNASGAPVVLGSGPASDEEMEIGCSEPETATGWLTMVDSQGELLSRTADVVITGV